MKTLAPALSEIDTLTREIRTLERHAVERAEAAIELKIQIGQRLIRAKEIMPHGTFLTWATAEFGWEPRHVQRHIVLARNTTRVSCLAPTASLRAALAAIAESADQGETPGAALSAEPRYEFVLVLDGGEELIVQPRHKDAEALSHRDGTAGVLRVRPRAA